MREAAHALAPGGRLIVALANYDSLSCRMGRFLEGDTAPLYRPPRRGGEGAWAYFAPISSSRRGAG